MGQADANHDGSDDEANVEPDVDETVVGELEIERMVEVRAGSGPDRGATGRRRDAMRQQLGDTRAAANDAERGERHGVDARGLQRRHLR